jgi:integrase/recombinase XerD
MLQRSLPDPVLIPLEPDPTKSSSTATIAEPLTDSRQLQVEEFLQARSLQPKSRKAYQHDLQVFMNWADASWRQVNRRQVAQFKRYLLEEKHLAPNSVNRTLQTLKTFFKWLVRSGYINTDPTTEVQQERVPEPKAKDLEAEEVASIYVAIEQRRWKERDRALWTVLLHGLRAQEVSNLNVADYASDELIVRQAKHDSTGEVPLTMEGKADLDAYLNWLTLQTGQVLTSDHPLFVSLSPRSWGQRLTYWEIRQIVDQLAATTGIDLHSHRGRHTFATRLVVDLEMDPTLAMELTRHRDPRSFKRYTNRKTKLAAKRAFLKATGQLPT